MQRAKTMPQGYILGRTSGGTGDVELLSPAQLRRLGIKQGRGAGSRTAGFGFFAEGLLDDNEVIGAAIFPFDVTYVDGDENTIASCQIKPTATATFKLMSIDSGGLPVQVGSIVFTSASYTGTVSWVGGTFLQVEGKPVQVNAPTPDDGALASPSATVTGSK